MDANQHSDLARKVISKLRFSEKPVTGAILALQCGVDIRQIQEAIQEIRTTDDNGVWHFIIIENDKEKGYRLSRNIEEAVAYTRRLYSRAVSYHTTIKGCKEALRYMMDVQGITGTLFDRPVESEFPEIQEEALI